MPWSDLKISNPAYWPRVGTLVSTTGGGVVRPAVIFAIVSGGVITSLNIIDGGQYASVPTVVFTGTGSGASATAVLSGTAITSFTSLVGGTGYFGTAPAWKLNNPGNVWDTLLDTLSNWPNDVNGGAFNLSNIRKLSLSNDGEFGAGYFTLVPGELPGVTYTVTGASWSGGTLMFTIPAHTIQQDQVVQIYGANFSILGVYNNAFVRVTARTGTTISIALAVNPGTWSSGGTVIAGPTAPVKGMIAPDATGTLNRYDGSAWQSIAGAVPSGALTSTAIVVGGGGSVLSTPSSLATVSAAGVITAQRYRSPSNQIVLSSGGGAFNDLNIGSRAYVFITGPTAPFSITGIAGGVDGDRVLIQNNTNQALTLPYNSGSSASGNRILNYTGTALVLANTPETGNYVELVYSPTGFWQVTNHG